MLRSEAHISRSSKHSGAVKTLQFNPFRSELLASAGAKGELYITDLNNISNPFRLGNTAARADDIECLDWNKKVPHIMVTGSSGGFVTVWDVKAKKESLTLNNLGRKAVSAIAWDPDKPTKLMTAIPLDTDPLILLWDLRNSNAPEKVLRGHEQGVLSLSWCPQDSDLMLSCGKDNRTICWNPQTGQPYGDFPVVTNWTFQTRWNPHNPNLFATASFDGKIAVQTIQSIGSNKNQEGESQATALDGEDFFSRAQTRSQADTFSLPKPPKWMEPPVALSFGFGGKVVSVTRSEPGSRTSKIRISTFEVDSKIGTATEGFEKELQAGNLHSICESRIASAASEEEKADWKVMETLMSKNPRKDLIDYLGFSTDGDETADGVSNLKSKGAQEGLLSASQINGSADKKHNRLSSFFDSAETDSFLSDLAASKGAKTNNPFEIYTGSESESDRRVTRALILGEFEKALDICLQEDRMSDAFMIAICGGPKCIEKAQAAYFSKQSGGPNYLRLLASVVGKNLWDTVHNADLSNWKEVMATLCTFADSQEFPDLCEALGDRLDEQMRAGNDNVSRKDASFCYIAGSKLEKVVNIWVEELEEKEQNGQTKGAGDSSFSIHSQALQDLIEKVTVFREVTNFQDSEKRKTSDWKLASLYDKYIEYADVVASHGQISVADRYLNLLPEQYPLAEMARNRVREATRKAAPKVTTSQAALPVRTTSKQTSKPLPPIGGYQPQQPQLPATTAPPPSTNLYAPAGANQSANPYAPSPAIQTANPYAPPTSTPYGGYPPSHQMRQPNVVPPPPQQFSSSQYSQPVAPPPRQYNQSPAIPPPSQDKNMSNWNDIPENFTKPPTSRRGTPALGSQAISSPFPNQPLQQQMVPPQPGPPRQRATPPVAPPPKGAAPPQRVTSPLASGQSVERPSSSVANAYAPPTQSQYQAPPTTHNIPPPMKPPIPRGPSPYNAPPSAPPPSNRYAPNPAVQSSGPPSHPPTTIPPPPSASSFHSPPPVNPYAPQQQRQASHSGQYAPMSPTTPSMPHQPQPQAPSQAPQQAPPPTQGSRPGTAQSQKKATPAPPKHRELPACNLPLLFFNPNFDPFQLPATGHTFLQLPSLSMRSFPQTWPVSRPAPLPPSKPRSTIQRNVSTFSSTT